MNGRGESDSLILPEKPSKKGCGAPQSAEGVERRRLAKGNLAAQNRVQAQDRRALQRALDRVRQAANQPFVRHHPRQKPSALAAHAGICAGGAG
jgi:hypothetical protein